MCCYFREKLHIDHFCVLKVEIEALLDRTAWREKWTWFTPHDMKFNLLSSPPPPPTGCSTPLNFIQGFFFNFPHHPSYPL